MKFSLSLTILLLFLLNSYIAKSQVNLASGLVAYYPFNGNANDASGNGNNSIFNNATLTTDRMGKANSAYHFNGIDNYIEIPNSPSINPANQISLCVYVRPTGFYLGPCHGNSILMKGDADYLPGNYALRFDDNAYTYGNNCANSIVDTVHQNFYGVTAQAQSPGYLPYINKNEWYCVVFTYDGSLGKFYVDGNLTDSEYTSNLTFSNGSDLFFGKLNNSTFPYWLNGDLDEIRIYNRAINDQEVKALCTTTSDTTVINDYTPVINFNICKNQLTVEDASKYNIGDTVLLIQMKGAVIDSSNTASFGTITNYKNAGNYEFNYIKSKTGNIIGLKNTVTKQYDVANGKVQLIRVPYYDNYTVSNTLTCLPWDGSKGGVLVLNAKDSISLSADINVSGKGFDGGNSPNPNTTTLYCDYNDYYYSLGSVWAADKGESIANTGDEIAWGKGASANGGGGGNGHNSGGGGGSNGGAGGYGGYQLDACGGSSTDNRGLGGRVLTYDNFINKIFMGGGGGSGQTDNAGGSPMNGGNGGGIIIIKAPVILNTGSYIITSRGADAPKCTLSPIDLCHDGNGGGGGGGTVLLENLKIINPTDIDVSGGKGADLVVYFQPNAGKIGTGGGGGGGSIWSSNSTLASNIFIINQGGANGVIIPENNDPYGATAGQPGQTLFNLKIPFDTIPFKPNIDSVRFKDSAVTCSSFDFKGLVFTNTNAITSWQWDFGDTSTASTQNTNHIYTSSGSYIVKLIASDVNGCKDSVSRPLTTSSFNVAVSNDTATCFGNSVQLTASGGNVYSWTPASTLNNPSASNPIATPLSPTTYHVLITNAIGCTQSDSIKVTVNSLPVITKSNDTSVCNNASVQLSAGGGTAYSWMPASSLNDPTISNPVATPPSTTFYYVTVTNSNGCAKKDSIKINTSVPAVITKSADENICKGTSVQISANGGASYSWSPASSLSDTYISNPIASPFSSTSYYVVVDNGYGCTKKDSVKVSVYPVPDITISNDTSICNSSSVKLFVAGGRSYLWSPSSSLDNPVSSAPVASPLINTLYKVTVTDANSCSFQDSVNISIKPLAVFTVSPDASVCTLTPKQLIAAGGDTYIWSPSDGLNQINIPNPIATPDATTVYSVTIVESVCNQTATLSTTLTALPLPSVHATSSNDLTCSLGSSQLNVSGAESYTWSPSSGLNDNNVPNPVATPVTTTLYHVSGKDNNGCTGSDTVTVKTDYNMNALYLLPNSFTPNGDGLNDCFGIKYWGMVSDLEFSIYNRFGQKVFYTNNAANCWDGTYRQQPQDADVFIYTITAKTACGLVNRKGSVTLIR